MSRSAKPEQTVRWPRQIVLVLALLLAWSSAMQAGAMAFQTLQPGLSLRFDADNPIALVENPGGRKTRGLRGADRHNRPNMTVVTVIDFSAPPR